MHQPFGTIEQRPARGVGRAAERIIHRDKFPFTMAAADPASKVLNLDLGWPSACGAVLIKVEFGLHFRRLNLALKTQTVIAVEWLSPPAHNPPGKKYIPSVWV